jgi:hypothetical protein
VALWGQPLGEADVNRIARLDIGLLPLHRFALQLNAYYVPEGSVVIRDAVGGEV